MYKITIKNGKRKKAINLNLQFAEVSTLLEIITEVKIKKKELENFLKDKKSVFSKGDVKITIYNS